LGRSPRARSSASDDAEGQLRLAAFQGLQQLGWSVGGNVRIDYRWGAGDADRFRRYAAELVAIAPDVILATSGTTVPWLLQATRSVPIVFTQTPDPVVRAVTSPGSLISSTQSAAHFWNCLRRSRPRDASCRPSQLRVRLQTHGLYLCPG
jgi:hypothetical protein